MNVLCGVCHAVSGSGTPWNVNQNELDNSTEACAKLLKVFINRFFPKVEVRLPADGFAISHWFCGARA